MLLALAAAGFLTALGTLLLVGGTFARRALAPAHPRPGFLALGFALLVLGAGLEAGWTLNDLGFLTFPDALTYVTTTAPGRAALTTVMGGALLLAAVLLWGVAGEGHGGSHGPGTRVLTALHVGAMGVWVGGVVALLTVAAPTPAPARRFTPVSSSRSRRVSTGGFCSSSSAGCFSSCSRPYGCGAPSPGGGVCASSLPWRRC
ncbi:MAG: hypothetical protein AB1511_15380, partial [Deinococcota bacterium]